MGSTAIEPVFKGYVDTPRDALLLIEAALIGILAFCPKRLSTEERKQIKSGSIYIYKETESKIKRWTEGFNWGPSRILGHFLIYKELLQRPCDDRDNLQYKPDGLIKKAFSVKVDGMTIHLINYYTEFDLSSSRLETPGNTLELNKLVLGRSYQFSKYSKGKLDSKSEGSDDSFRSNEETLQDGFTDLDQFMNASFDSNTSLDSSFGTLNWCFDDTSLDSIFANTPLDSSFGVSHFYTDGNKNWDLDEILQTVDEDFKYDTAFMK
jgi:hypothetical protein